MVKICQNIVKLPLALSSIVIAEHILPLYILGILELNLGMQRIILKICQNIVKLSLAVSTIVIAEPILSLYILSILELNLGAQ